MKRICGFLLVLLLFVILVPTHNSQASVTSNKLKGRILLQVDSNGEAWYVNPENEYRYYLGRPNDAFKVMRELGLGVSNNNFDSFQGKAPKTLSGRILLKVEDSGKAYYVNPVDLKIYYLGRPEDAFNVMRTLGLGISNDNLAQIKKSAPLTVGYIRTGSLYYKGEFLKPRYYEMEDYCYNSDALNNQAIPAFKGNHLKKYSLFNGDNLTFGDVDCNCVDGACLENTCYDSDGGKNTGVKGETFGDYSGNLYDRFVVNFVVNKDECINSNQLTEFYCINNTQSGSETVDCPCLDGECVGVDLSSTKCYDSDGGNNPYSRGETYGNYNGDVYDYFVVHKDQCASKTQLNEYYCVDDKQSTGTGVSCECLDGACVK